MSSSPPQELVLHALQELLELPPSLLSLSVAQLAHIQAQLYHAQFALVVTFSVAHHVFHAQTLTP